jgi:carbonic anhydrase
MFQRKMARVIAIAFGDVAITGGLVFATPNISTNISPDDALQNLMDGNKHFSENKRSNAGISDTVIRTSLTNRKKPYAIILSCSDFRVPAEIIFDKGLGEIFVVRVAGNVLERNVLGSIEYAAEHLGSPLIMVFGHERYGEATAAVDTQVKSTDSKKNNCAACKGEKDFAAAKKPELANGTIDTNAKTIAANLTKQSEILKYLVEEKKVKIVAAKYDMVDGIVTILKEE